MVKLTQTTLVCILLASGLACAGGIDPDLRTSRDATGVDPAGEPRRDAEWQEREAEEREAEEREATLRPADPELARQVDRALERVLATGQREGVSVLAECGDDGTLTETRIFGSGVGIWNRSRQFTVEPARLTRLLERFRKVDFARFQEIYGEIEDEVPIPEEGASALQVICRVALTVGDVTKQSAQLSDGPRSEALHDLADRILALGRRQGPEGVAATSLDDGLTKIADGALAPEMLSVLLHRKPDANPGSTGGTGFLLRIEGGTVSVRSYTPAGGYGEPVTSDLDPAEAAELARQLAASRPGDLPLNLFANEYTDLVIEVLDHRIQIQARTFSGMTRFTHGADQGRFDRLYETLAELAERTLAPAEAAGG